MGNPRASIVTNQVESTVSERRHQRELIRSRTSEGTAHAKARGVKLGRKPKLTSATRGRGTSHRG